MESGNEHSEANVDSDLSIPKLDPFMSSVSITDNVYFDAMSVLLTDRYDEKDGVLVFPSRQFDAVFADGTVRILRNDTKMINRGELKSAEMKFSDFDIEVGLALFNIHLNQTEEEKEPFYQMNPDYRAIKPIFFSIRMICDYMGRDYDVWHSKTRLALKRLSALETDLTVFNHNMKTNERTETPRRIRYFDFQGEIKLANHSGVRSMYCGVIDEKYAQMMFSARLGNMNYRDYHNIKLTSTRSVARFLSTIRETNPNSSSYYVPLDNIARCLNAGGDVKAKRRSALRHLEALKDHGINWTKHPTREKGPYIEFWFDKESCNTKYADIYELAELVYGEEILFKIGFTEELCQGLIAQWGHKNLKPEERTCTNFFGKIVDRVELTFDVLLHKIIICGEPVNSLGAFSTHLYKLTETMPPTFMPMRGYTKSLRERAGTIKMKKFFEKENEIIQKSKKESQERSKMLQESVEMAWRDYVEKKGNITVDHIASYFYHTYFDEMFRVEKSKIIILSLAMSRLSLEKDSKIFPKEVYAKIKEQIYDAKVKVYNQFLDKDWLKTKYSEYHCSGKIIEKTARFNKTYKKGIPEFSVTDEDYKFEMPEDFEGFSFELDTTDLRKLESQFTDTLAASLDKEESTAIQYEDGVEVEVMDDVIGEEMVITKTSSGFNRLSFGQSSFILEQ